MHARLLLPTFLLSLFILSGGCGGPQESAHPSPPPVASVAIMVPEAGAPASPSLPAEPAGLVVVAPPGGACQIADGPGDRLLIQATGSGVPLVRVRPGPMTAKLSPEGDAYVEVTAPGYNVRGFISKTRVSLRAARWFSFGGVVYPGTAYTLGVTRVHDTNVVLFAPAIQGLTLTESAQSTDVACADVSLSAAALDVVAREVPPLFAPKGTPRDMVFRTKKAIGLSADPKGPVVATLLASDEPRNVVVSEQLGKQARIRMGHVAGWMDAALLTGPDMHSARAAALREAAEFGMIGLYSSGYMDRGGLGGNGSTNDASAETAEPALYTCRTDVRLVAVSGVNDRAVLGSIPAGAQVRVMENGPELTRVDVSGLTPQKGVRLTVPARDMASCSLSAAPVTAAPAAEAPAASATASTATASTAATSSTPPALDAIDVLDGRVAQDTEGGPGAIGMGGIGLMPGSQGFGLGPSDGMGAVKPRPSPSLRQGATTVTGRLPPEVIQRIVRQNFGRFRLCYEQGLRLNPVLAGKVVVKFEIDPQGEVKSAVDSGSDLPDTAVVRCVVRGMRNLSFPQPESGSVTVTYPIIFAPPPPP